jgi:hypothetical protein
MTQEFTEGKAARWVDMAFDQRRSESWQAGWKCADDEIARIFIKPPRLIARRDEEPIYPRLTVTKYKGKHRAVAVDLGDLASSTLRQSR